MRTSQLGFCLIVTAAASSGIIPVVTDGLFMARAHMLNPRWLPHAKLHCAMSFFGAFGLSVGAFAMLFTRPASDRVAIATATFLSTVFWIGLLLSGLLPMTSYQFLNDPDAYIPPPKVLGIVVVPNVAAAILFTILGWTGFFLYRP